MSVLRALLPRPCPGCARDLGVARGLCQACLDRLAPRVVRQSVLVPHDEPHLVVLGRYEGRLRRAIRAFKFTGSRELGGVLATRLAEAMPTTWAPDVVCPVPLHPRREAARGFNQAALLSTGIATALGTRHEALLVRTRDTAQQARLDRGSRERNVAGVFSLTRPVRGQHVLLVDDVLTTGATLRAGASVLRAAGAASVRFVVLAD